MARTSILFRYQKQSLYRCTGTFVQGMAIVVAAALRSPDQCASSCSSCLQICELLHRPVFPVAAAEQGRTSIAVIDGVGFHTEVNCARKCSLVQANASVSAYVMTQTTLGIKKRQKAGAALPTAPELLYPRVKQSLQSWLFACVLEL